MEVEIPHPPFTPIPTTLTVSHEEFTNNETGKREQFVQIALGFPNGIVTFYMTPDATRQFIDNVKIHADIARSGLFIAGELPNSNGHKA